MKKLPLNTCFNSVFISTLFLSFLVSIVFSGNSYAEHTVQSENTVQKKIHLSDSSSLSFPNENWLVINYFAVWCKPCIKEIPEFNQLTQANKSSPLTVLAVDYDEPENLTLKQHIQQLNIQFPVAETSPHQLIGFDLPDALPTTLIITPTGEVKKILKGPQTAAGLTALLTSLGYPNSD